MASPRRCTTLPAARGKETPMATGEDGRIVQEVLLAGYRSAKIGAKIGLPFRPTGVKRPIDLWLGATDEDPVTSSRLSAALGRYRSLLRLLCSHPGEDCQHGLAQFRHGAEAFGRVFLQAALDKLINAAGNARHENGVSTARWTGARNANVGGRACSGTCPETAACP